MNPDWNAGPKTVRGSTRSEAAEFEIKRLQDSNEQLRARVEELLNDNVEQGAILEAIMGALKGDEPSDFMRSFPDVEHAWWVYRLAYPTTK